MRSRQRNASAGWKSHFGRPTCFECFLQFTTAELTNGKRRVAIPRVGTGEPFVGWVKPTRKRREAGGLHPPTPVNMQMRSYLNCDLALL